MVFFFFLDNNLGEGKKAQQERTVATFFNGFCHLFRFDFKNCLFVSVHGVVLLANMSFAHFVSFLFIPLIFTSELATVFLFSSDTTKLHVIYKRKKQEKAMEKKKKMKSKSKRRKKRRPFRWKGVFFFEKIKNNKCFLLKNEMI